MNTQFRINVLYVRFQVDRLTGYHLDLLDWLNTNCDNLLVILGSPASRPTENDPLDFQTRKIMINEHYPDIMVKELVDSPAPTVWTKKLDQLIEQNFPNSNITLYGSRHSLLSTYQGDHTCQFLEPNKQRSKRQLTARTNPANLQDLGYRQGVMQSIRQRPSLVYPTVDIAILNEDRTQVLLAHKTADGNLWRFIGGFVDTTDTSLEVAAKREAFEETSYALELDCFHYLGSTVINDWRYANSKDGIQTSFFTAKRIFGHLKPGDDIDRLAWYLINEELLAQLVQCHQPLGEMLIAHLNGDN